MVSKLLSLFRRNPAAAPVPLPPKRRDRLVLEVFFYDDRPKQLPFWKPGQDTCEVLNEKTGLCRYTIFEVSESQFFEAMKMFNETDQDFIRISFKSIAYFRGDDSYSFTDSGVTYRPTTGTD